MLKSYSVNENNFGYLLVNNSDANDKIVLYRSKPGSNSVVDYYAKQVEPEESYLSGMFYDKRKQLFTGKLKDSRRLNIKIRNATAFVEIN